MSNSHQMAGTSYRLASIRVYEYGMDIMGRLYACYVAMWELCTRFHGLVILDYC